MFLLCGAGFIILVGAGLMILWNWLIPSIFQGPTINFLQALGLFLLGKIIFGFGGGWKGCRHCHCHQGEHGKHGFWRKKFEEKFSHLSEEEKAKLKENYKKCCGVSDSNTDEK